MSRRIRLSDEAYERLDSYRRDGETFSAAVMRLTDEQADELEAAIEDRRDRRMAELESFAKRMEN